ncbi:hypothetical protein FHR32_005083 [Streptosporangium album]|uniref:Uncharacterized protein n=1 Tax=Streptosporangium album TaxID=47479 RepID=A0A7W7S0I7_9ACTN|nr:hypothetical protein [Streptosporangium album]MBB4940706.1 hypothetical protein [Streptosporangium album]
MRLPVFVVALASAVTVTATAGVVVLLLMEPADLGWSPFVYVAVASLVLAAAAGAVHVAQVRRARRFIGRLRDVGAEMAAEGYFDADRDQRLVADVFDARETPWER